VLASVFQRPSRSAVGESDPEAMPKPHVPDLKKYMGKRVSAKLNAGREVTGTLMGFDQYMNIVLEAASEGVSASERREIGSVVRFAAHHQWPSPDARQRARAAHRRPSSTCCRTPHSPPRLRWFSQVIRGSSVIQLQCLDRVY